MIELTAELGKTLRLREEEDGDCAGCGQHRDVMPIDVRDSDGRSRGEVRICGRCVATAIAVHLTSRIAMHDEPMEDQSR